ncbi:MAG: M3 family metallopeptidase [Rhodoluna sp.]|nr:M3 family metallopeptidase [Rhodoluna sp.]MBP6186181.1 M3 family metallopeptidase [Rhodoluna sp.]
MTFNAENPFALRSTLEYELPDFTKIRDEHYLPAFYAGCEEHLAEIDAILASGEATFDNTIVAMERAGKILERMLMVFYNKSSSDTSPELDKIEAEIAPKLSAHSDTIRLNPVLYARVEDLYNKRESLGLDAEGDWLLVRYYEDFRQAGAHLSDTERAKAMEINQRLAELDTKFSQQLLNDTNDLAVLVDDVAELDGLSAGEIAAAADLAKERGHEGKWLLAMVNFTGNPMLETLTNRALREKIMKNSLLKGGRANENDNRPILLEMARLRAEKAQLFGYESHAHYVLTDRTAKNPGNVHEMLRKIAPAARRNAELEGADIQAAIEKSGESFKVQSYDWDLYTEKVRLEKYNIDTELFKPYFELDRVLFDGVFFAATKLFGITFKERKDLVAYHPEARVFEVFNEDGSKLALFIGDFFTRESKRGGAWMNNLVDQNHLLGQLPVVVNNLNIPKPAKGEPALLSFDFTTTLFHEFGHAIHGMLSNVNYPRFSGTSTPRDFVEFPSQVNEMWMLWPEVVENFAKHCETGEALPQEWIDNLKRAETFNQGHATVSYLSAAVLDLAWHQLTPEQIPSNVEEFEAKAIADYGLDFDLVPTRYRSTYFSHIFAGGYSAGYYGYIWSEVLDADTVDWFKNNGGLTRANGDHFRNELLSRGGTQDALQLFRNFRGKDASIEPLLKRRGLL